jgi:predicted ferric reductase
MDLEKSSLVDIQTVQPSMTLQSVLLLFLAVVMGALMAGVLLPAWMPGLAGSLVGQAPKVYWYLSRGSAFVAFGLLWLSMASGLIISNQLARLWPGGPMAFDLHEYTSLLGLAFAVFHALILLGDRFINYTLPQLLIPFGSINYHPTWVALGQIGIYLWIPVAFSFYVRKKIGTRSWRVIHFVSFASFALALAHGVTSGTDSGTLWATRMYWYAGASLLFLTVYRVLVNPRLPFVRLFQAQAPKPSIQG